MNMEINKYIEHTLLKADATEEQFRQLCDEAREYNFLAVCVNPGWISYCKKQLEGSTVKICTVIGFPLGATLTQAKALEANEAVKEGADELDMVINIGYLKSGKYQEVVDDIVAVVKAAGDLPVKVIIETCLLSESEKVLACKAVLEAKAAFVKTSTGFSTAGATVEDVILMKSIVKDSAGIKAAGGVSNVLDLYAMVENGANRIGTSRGVTLMKALDGETVTTGNEY